MTRVRYSHDSAGSEFSDWLDMLLRHGADLVALIQAFFDESYGNTSDVLCVAGFVFTKDKCKGLNVGWGNMLRRAKRLPYFRMSACATGNPPFDRLTPSERDQVAREAIGLITRYASLGVALSVNEREFATKVPPDARKAHGGPYEFLAWNALMAVRAWMDMSNFDGKVAYVFEAGHAHQGKAHALMDRIFKVPELRAAYRYHSHSFVAKEESRPCQAADVLAWQWFKDKKGQAEGRPRRKDLAALLVNGPLFAVRHIDVDRHVVVSKEVLDEISREIAAGTLKEPVLKHAKGLQPVVTDVSKRD